MSRYQILIEKLFEQKYNGPQGFVFTRSELENIARNTDIEVPKNLGDLVYSFRYRSELPASIADTAPENKEWVVQGAGRGKYKFVLSNINRILPNTDIVPIKIPKAHSTIMDLYSTNDEQALLNKIRFNQVLDIFLGIKIWLLQSHLRTAVDDIGQIEIDDLYAGVSKEGCQFIIPVQAKSKTDKIAVPQIIQDIKYCNKVYPNLVCRAVAIYFFNSDLVALFELFCDREEQIHIIEERHYELVTSVDSECLDLYKNSYYENR